MGIEGRIQTVSSLNNLNHYLPHVSSMYVTPHTPNNNFYLVTFYIFIYRVSQEEQTKLREGVPCVKLYRYNPKHLYPKLNGYADNGKRSLKL